jgi:hypothetical protein
VLLQAKGEITPTQINAPGSGRVFYARYAAANAKLTNGRLSAAAGLWYVEGAEYGKEVLGI